MCIDYVTNMTPITEGLCLVLFIFYCIYNSNGLYFCFYYILWEELRLQKTRQKMKKILRYSIAVFFFFLDFFSFTVSYSWLEKKVEVIVTFSTVLFCNQLGFTSNPECMIVLKMTVLTLSCEYCYWNSWVTELNEGSSFINTQSIPGQQDVLCTNKAMD